MCTHKAFFPQGPPPDPAYNFLSDRYRHGERQPEKGDPSRRHPKNYGGEDFGNVKNRMRKERDRQVIDRASEILSQKRERQVIDRASEILSQKRERQVMDRAFEILSEKRERQVIDRAFEIFSQKREIEK